MNYRIAERFDTAGIFDELEPDITFGELKQEAYEEYLAFLSTAYDKEKAMLDEFHKFGFLSEQEYLERLGNLRTEEQIKAEKDLLAATEATAKELIDANEATAKQIESKWQEVGGIMSNVFYEAFDGQMQNIEDLFDNLWKRILADLASSGLMALIASLTGGTAGGIGFFGGGGLFSGLFGASGGITNNINVEPAPITLRISPIELSRGAEEGDIMRGVS